MRMALLVLAMIGCEDEAPKGVPLCNDLGCGHKPQTFCNFAGVCSCDGQQCQACRVDAGPCR